MAYRPGDPVIDPNGGVNLKERRDDFIARHPGATPTDDPATLQGQPGVTFDVITGISVDRREVPEEYKKNLRYLLAKFRSERLAKLEPEEAERFAESCDVIDDRSDGAPHNID